MSIAAVFHGPAIRIAARFTAFALARCRTQPFFERFSGDHPVTVAIRQEAYSYPRTFYRIKLNK
jgi:hypothetical protein